MRKAKFFHTPLQPPRDGTIGESAPVEEPRETVPEGELRDKAMQIRRSESREERRKTRENIRLTG